MGTDDIAVREMTLTDVLFFMKASGCLSGLSCIHFFQLKLSVIPFPSKTFSTAACREDLKDPEIALSKDRLFHNDFT